MSMQRVGTCSNCGGNVMGFRGPWMATVPPPPDQCSSCGGKAQSDVIKIQPPVRVYPDHHWPGTAIPPHRRGLDNWTESV